MKRFAGEAPASMRSALLALALLCSFPARPALATDCTHALPDTALAGSMLESLPPGAAILFWGDSVTVRGGDNNFAQMFVRIVNASFDRFCEDGSTAPSRSLRALMRGRSQRKSYREANDLRATVETLQPYWVAIQDAGESTPLSPASGNGFADDLEDSIDAVFEPQSGAPPASTVKALFLFKTPPLDEPGRDFFVCQAYATACNWTAHNVVLEQVASAQVGRTVVTVPTDADACTAMAQTAIDFAQDGVHPEKLGYFVYALSLLRAMGVDIDAIPDAVLVAQDLTLSEVTSIRAALLGPPASSGDPRCTMDPACQPQYLADSSNSASALECIAYCQGPGAGSCRPPFRGVGSCCLATAVCVDGVTADACPALGDLYNFYGPVGACCDPVRGCLDEAGKAVCEAGGGVYQGDGGRCVAGCCDAPSSCPACGNGVIEDGEECDDGNRSDGDCCAWNCAHEESDGAACDDGTFCNGADSCVAGACTVHAGDPCSVSSVACEGICNEADDSCDLAAGSACSDAATCSSAECAASGSCVCDGDGHCSLGDLCPICAGARNDCADPGKSRVELRSLSGGATRSFSLKSSGRGEIVHPSDFGDPTSAAGSGLALCVYLHDASAAPTRDDLLWQAPFAAGEICAGGVPCWTSSATKLAYSRSQNETSLRARILTAATTARLRLSIQASGAALGLPDVLGIAGDQSITVQLLTQSVSGATTRCWQETFDEGALKSTDEIYTALTTH